MEERFLPPHNTYEVVIGVGAGLNPSKTDLSNATRAVVTACQILYERSNESGERVITDSVILVGRPDDPDTGLCEAQAMGKALHTLVPRLVPPLSHHWDLEVYARLIARIMRHKGLTSAVVVADHLMAHRVEEVFYNTLCQKNGIKIFVLPTFGKPESNPTLASRIKQIGAYIAAAYYKSGSIPAHR